MNENEIKSYDELVENIKLRNLCLENLSFKRFNVKELKGKKAILVNFETKDPNINEIKNENIIIHQPVNFHLSFEDDPSIKLFELNATYEILYRLEYKVDSNFITEYINNNIPKLLHPYLRELISSSIQQAGLPPYILPLYENL